MPSHTPASGLVKLFFHNEIPWKYPQWQEITGIMYGLFPVNDHHLPKGWTRQDANDVLSYFKQYQQIDSEDNKIKFATRNRDKTIPGRTKWSKFVSDNWERWKVHDRIVDGLRQHNIHPITLLVQENSLDKWPSSDHYIPIALDTIGQLLWGPEAFSQSDILPFEVRKGLTALVQRSWARIGDRHQRDKATLPKLEKEVLDAFEGTFITLQPLFTLITLTSILIEYGKGKATLSKTLIIKTICAVSQWKNMSEVYAIDEILAKADDMLSELNRVMEGLGATVPKCKSSTGKRMHFTSLSPPSS
jgi:TATA-binding protein-associated factor